MCMIYLQSRQDDIRLKFLSADVKWQIHRSPDAWWQIPIMSADSKMSVKSSGLSGSSYKNFVGNNFDSISLVIVKCFDSMNENQIQYQHLQQYPHYQMLCEQTFGRDPKRRVRGRITVSSMNSARIVLRFECQHMNIIMQSGIEHFPMNTKAICNPWKCPFSDNPVPLSFLSSFSPSIFCCCYDHLWNGIPISVKAEPHVVSVQCVCAQITLR